MVLGVKNKKRWLRKMSPEGVSNVDGLCVGDNFHPEQKFRAKLLEERRRAERSCKPLVLMAISLRKTDHECTEVKMIEEIKKVLVSTLRATDIYGILKEKTVLGVILLEIEHDKIMTAEEAIRKKIREKINEVLNQSVANSIVIDFSIYLGTGSDKNNFNLIFYPDINVNTVKIIVENICKRTMDITGGVIGICLSLPVIFIVAVAIKATSRGPILFCQNRIGLNGKSFKLYKFRTMHLDSEDIIHRQYVRKLIKGEIPKNGRVKMVYKMESDPRITTIGRYLRKYSVDELPQLVNVLKGDMSLVGPRPPIAYEVDEYCSWQRGRLMGKKPGITGLWQVMGRSSTTFDEMVRLDLRYLRKWTILMDLKILLRTPLAVVKCKGAY